MLRLPYFIHQALRSLRESFGTSLLTSATIAAALLVLGAYVMALANLESLSLVWGRAASVAALLEDGVPSTEWERVRGAMAQLSGVEKATLVTPTEAMARFRARGAEARALVQDVPDTVLPAMVELSLASGFVDVGAIANLAQAAKGVPGVREVDYGEEELAGLTELLHGLRWAGLVGGVFLLLATAFIVSSTIRLAVYARKDEIAILELVGATRWFIRTPFLLEGAAWGLLGGVFAASTAGLLESLFAAPMSERLANISGGLAIHFVSLEVALGMLVLGLFLGVLGSALAVRRFLEANPQ